MTDQSLPVSTKFRIQAAINIFYKVGSGSGIILLAKLFAEFGLHKADPTKPDFYHTARFIFVVVFGISALGALIGYLFPGKPGDTAK